MSLRPQALADVATVGLPVNEYLMASLEKVTLSKLRVLLSFQVQHSGQVNV